MRETAYEVGKQYLIRTVSNYYTGRIKEITQDSFVLEEAAWIPETTRWSDCLKHGTFNEVEPYVDDCIVMRSVIVDGTVWGHPLPREPK